MAGDVLSATFPDDSGLIGVLECRPASIADYNTAVTAFVEREAELWQAEWDRQQAQLAEARRMARSCSMTVHGHDATLVVEGVEGVVDKCLELAERSAIAEGWHDVVYPVGSVGGSAVCIGTLDGYDVGVFDTGFAKWGTAISVAKARESAASLKQQADDLLREAKRTARAATR